MLIGRYRRLSNGFAGKDTSDFAMVELEDLESVSVDQRDKRQSKLTISSMEA
jgi:hypothetical protein